ncbi:hypothetical protein DdX_18227 [Ditylenchus destructor]|uniref:Uncharacterized protein n=1 Tax=Ditylenchus destructor TaxID=166010 RepID=A0AAD4MPX7_9BILA|nr:hypothetical protein DdX_18227 [Ditylenchus destructor]
MNIISRRSFVILVIIVLLIEAIVAGKEKKEKKEKKPKEEKKKSKKDGKKDQPAGNGHTNTGHRYEPRDDYNRDDVYYSDGKKHSS